jgi:hypothetical protein
MRMVQVAVMMSTRLARSTQAADGAVEMRAMKYRQLIDS